MRDVQLGDGDQVAFTASLEEPFVSFSDVGLWKEESGKLRAVAIGDMPVPNNEDTSIASIDSWDMNRHSQIVLSGRMDERWQNRRATAVFAEDSDSVLHEILRSGNALEVQPGDTRIVDFVGSDQINDFGQVLLYASFTDGSEGFFLSDQVAVPEPRFSLLLAAILMVFLRHQFGTKPTSD